jgi:hypothetical protein
MINIIRILIAIALLSLTANAFAREINQNAKASVSNSVKDKLDKKNKIIAFIKLVQPKYSTSYAARIAEAIFKSSVKYGVDPMLVVSTAYVESEFSMHSKPCIGIMQLVKSSIRFFDQKKTLNPYKLEDNIDLGTKEISYHLKRTTRRGNIPDHSSTSRALQRYNGSGSKISYAIKVLLVKNRLMKYSIDSLKKKLKLSPLWR